MNLSEDDLRRMGYTIRDGVAFRPGAVSLLVEPSAKPNKYKNKPTYVGDLRFDSKHEAECWLALQARQQAGEILNLDRQFAFELHCGTDTGLRIVVCEYVADFVWFDLQGNPHIGDAKSKGTLTALYKLKAKWMNLEYGITIEEL